MPFKQKLKKLLTGLTIPQEYVCLDIEEYKDSLSVFLTDSKDTPMDASPHLFLGYKPLIIGFSCSSKVQGNPSIENLNSIRLTFKFNGEGFSSRPLAMLKAKKIGEKMLGDNLLIFFEGTYGWHLFLNSFNQFVNRYCTGKGMHGSTNINLEENLYEQVRIAYSIPRVISIITVADSSLLNMFPTDLHGPIGKKYYAGSLRVGGIATEQIEKYKNIVISEVCASSYKYAYSLGKNHMQDLRQYEKFTISTEASEVFKLPLPVHVTRYRELKLIDSFDHGIHRIHMYEIIHQKAFHQNSTLGHIHQYCAQWRVNHGLETKMLLR